MPQRHSLAIEAFEAVRIVPDALAFEWEHLRLLYGTLQKGSEGALSFYIELPAATGHASLNS